MTNQIRGVISEEILGERLALRLSANEWCELEDEHGKSTSEILTEFFSMVSSENLRFGLLRSLFRAALSGAKPGITHEQAGEIMGQMDMVDVGRILGEAIVVSLPKVDPASVKGAPGKRKPPAKPAR